tara:strand:+ start:2196 stop:2384 length:189 start_codon:yes stop_codon:yes gene_type:complete
MPVKFKESVAKIGASRKKVGMTHSYMYTISTSELQKAMDNANTKPKLKQKIRNELVKRKVSV